MNSENSFPELPYEKCSETIETLHMKMQVVGKIKLALTTFINQWWNVALHLNTLGIASGLIPYKNTAFEISFDFLTQNLIISSSENKHASIPLVHGSVAEFYRQLIEALNSMDIFVTINKLPSEVPDPVPCDMDKRSVYEKDYVFTWWSILIKVNNIFERFRSRFRGKSSPVHFFWGSFDLCGSRFSGKLCNPPENCGVIMRYSENEENFTFGFWAGNKNYPHPAFYSYIYPAPAEIETIRINPPAFYSPEQKLFILNYDDVRKSFSPEKLILEFLEDTYSKSASVSGWDIEFLKTQTP